MIVDPNLQRRAFKAWVRHNPDADQWRAFQAAILISNVVEADGYDAVIAILEKPVRDRAAEVAARG